MSEQAASLLDTIRVMSRPGCRSRWGRTSPRVQVDLVRGAPMRNLPDQNGTSVPYGLMALTITDGNIATITGFPDPALFPIFGLPS
jgi:hypothetical protein